MKEETEIKKITGIQADREYQQMKNVIGPAFKALLGENRLEDLPMAFSNMSQMITSSMSMSMMD